MARILLARLLLSSFPRPLFLRLEISTDFSFFLSLLPPLFFHFFLPLPESTSRSFPPRKERTRSEKVTKRERRKVAAAAPDVESRRRPTRVPLPPHPRKRRWGWGEGKVGRRWDSGFLGRQPTRTRGTRTLNESATCRRK